MRDDLKGTSKSDDGKLELSLKDMGLESKKSHKQADFYIFPSKDTIYTDGAGKNPLGADTRVRSDDGRGSVDSIMLDSVIESQSIHISNNAISNNLTIKPFSKIERKKRQIRQAKVEAKKAVSICTQKDNDEYTSNEAKTLKAWRLFIVFGLFLLCFLIFMLAVYAKNIVKPPNMDPYNKKSRQYPWSQKANVDIALRGQISSLDNYILTSSKKLYRVSIYVPSIYEEKRQLLIKFLHLYANFDEDAVHKALLKGGNALIADNVNSIDAANLKILNQKLARLGVYKKCTFSYINKTSLRDSDIQTLFARAQIMSERGAQTPLDNDVLQIMRDLDNGDITQENAIEKLNIILVDYKNKDIDLSKECYTPIFTYNSDVKNNASTKIDRGLDVAVEQIKREYPFKNFMQPLLGFTNYDKRNIEGRFYDDKMKLIAQSGVEKYRDGILSAKRDGKVIGVADKSGNVILNRHSQSFEREDGFNIQLTIPLVLQSKIQKILEDANRQYNAQQIVAGIMDPNTGEILALASSLSFNPNIGQRDKDITNKMRVAAAERSFEPGSTIKPLVFSYLANRKLIDFRESIDLHDGIYKLRAFTIRDTSPLKSANPEQILIKSSNIGMTKLTKKLSGKEMESMFKMFGVGENTGVDIANEATGLLPKNSILGREVEKGAASYGYGLRMTFIQLLRSYAVFNNGGFLVTPHVTKTFIAPDSRIFYPTLESPRQIISKETSIYMNKLLHRIVKEGTAKRADVDGLIIGGKTGTAREKHEGETIYNGSFFGYASDGKTTYTIGVVAYGSQASEDYYAGQTAAPVFARIADLLAKEGYLQRKLD